MKRLDLNLGSFRKYVMFKKIICYGCGAAGIRAINILENWGKSQDIITFVDGDERKWNQTISNGDTVCSIVPLDEAVQMADESTIFLITCTSDILEIRFMLDSYKELENLECFSLVEIAQQQLRCSDYEKIQYESEKPLIPKILHYCWFGGEKPQFIQKMIASWREMCPDYEIIEWNETNYNFSKNRYMSQAYDAQVWGFVPDFARIDIIYHYGGIYIDTDVEIVQKPDALLYQSNFFISDGSFQVALGTGFGAVPGLPLLEEFMDYYNNVPFKLEDGTLNRLPCVTHQYNVLKKHGMKINDKFQAVSGANIYPMIMGGTNVYTMQSRKTEKTYFAHYGTASWTVNNVIEKRKKIRDYFQYDGLESYDLNKREI